MGVRTESMTASLHQSARLTLVTGLFSLPDFPHYLVNSVPVCQPCLPGTQECNLTSLSRVHFFPPLGLGSASSKDSPSPELGTQALHFSLETWIHSPKESIKTQAVSWDLECKELFNANINGTCGATSPSCTHGRHQ